MYRSVTLFSYPILPYLGVSHGEPYYPIYL